MRSGRLGGGQIVGYPLGGGGRRDHRVGLGGDADRRLMSNELQLTGFGARATGLGWPHGISD
ncbi:hypothetical protein MSAS_23130 [Mycobacterium saskatchewanense]|nr:hypothetical protein MSAS_23130 [Mycobacterium saskatchewanense]